MVIFSNILSLSGTELRSEELLSALVGDYLLEGTFEEGDVSKRHKYLNQRAVLIKNPVSYTVKEINDGYDEWYVEFIETNYETFVMYGVEEIAILIELFALEYGQCNVELLSQKSVKRLAKYDVALPVSIYSLSQKEMEELVAANPAMKISEWYYNANMIDE